MKDNFIFLHHIIDSIKKIELYIEGMSFEDFKKNDKTADAVVRNIEIVGEAASKCSLSFRKQFSKLPWREMIDMRNKVIHDYMGISFNVIWETCKKDLPPLSKKLEQIVKSN